MTFQALQAVTQPSESLTSNNELEFFTGTDTADQLWLEQQLNNQKNEDINDDLSDDLADAGFVPRDSGL